MTMYYDNYPEDPNNQPNENRPQNPQGDRNNRTSALQKLWRFTGLRDKTLWDLFSLLIVPLLLFFVTQQLSQNQKQVEENRARQEKEVADRKLEQEKATADVKAKRDRLNSYITSFPQLRGNRDAIKASTILAMKDLNGEYNSDLVSFLKQNSAIGISQWNCEKNLSKDGEPPKDDKGGKELEKQVANKCFNGRINLEEADLSKVNFEKADLSRVHLQKANLREADLRNAILFGTDLREAKLSEAKLSGANFTYANLAKAEIKDEQLVGARLCHTIMPDGTKRNDGCSNPEKDGTYIVQIGNNAGVPFSAELYVRFFPGKKQTPVAALSPGEKVTLTGDKFREDDTTWVKIKDDDRIGGWIQMDYLVKAN